MFSELINGTQFTSDIANETMSAISWSRYSNYGRDVTLISTLRALIFPRLNEGERLYVYLRNQFASQSTINAYDKETIVNYFYPNDIKSVTNGSEDPVFSWVKVSRYEKDGLDFLSENFLSVHPDYVEVKKVSLFFKKSFRVLCYIRPSTKDVVLFTSNVDSEGYHFIQCAIPAMFPWYFRDNQLSEDEINLLKSLEGDEADKYKECLSILAEKYNFRDQYIRSKLNNVENYIDTQRSAGLRNLISSRRSDIKSYSEYIATAMREIGQANDELFSIDERLNNKTDDSEMIEYFCCNKNIHLAEVEIPEIYFVATGYLEYYDKDLAIRVINNPNSIAYKYSGSYYNISMCESIKKLLTEIFIKETARIKVCAKFYMDINGWANAVDHADFSTYDFYTDYIPNEHIQRYACMGSYSQIVSSLMREKKYIEAIEQCMASCRSLNFGDSTVISSIMRTYFYEPDSFYRCIELNDGTTMTIKEALKWASSIGEENQSNE